MTMVSNIAAPVPTNRRSLTLAHISLHPQIVFRSQISQKKLPQIDLSQLFDLSVNELLLRLPNKCRRTTTVSLPAETFWYIGRHKLDKCNARLSRKSLPDIDSFPYQHSEELTIPSK